jgi:hypothetical protein
LSKANNYAARLITSNLTAMDAFIFHWSTYVVSMTYSLPVTTLDALQLNKIQSRSIPVILNKLGANRHFPHSVAFGPKDFCGLALLDLSIEQGVRQICHFMNHTFAQDSGQHDHNCTLLPAAGIWEWMTSAGMSLRLCSLSYTLLADIPARLPCLS